jgi:hypothetical protein
MNGGYRGRIHIVPAVPIGKDRRYLEWITAALRDFDDFFDQLSRGAPRTPSYRWRGLALRFYRSVGKTTPNAYAADWTVSYNVVGSLQTSADSARETLFHEVFHLNDAAHGDWSSAHLTASYDGIVRKCGARTACLAPYSPGDTMVRNGTYYSFQPGNDVHEYAAELAIRYYREQRAAMRGHPMKPAFKCGPDPNAKAWSSFVEEFFAGIDKTPACSP